MIEYAQKYKIGILSLEIPEEYKNKDIDNVDYSAFYINEIVPAPNQYPILSIQKDFLYGMGIHNVSDYNLFG